jgi:hypothetical protein
MQWWIGRQAEGRQAGANGFWPLNEEFCPVIHCLSGSAQSDFLAADEIMSR